MQRVAYHRLAAAELIKSARFYDRRRMGLGDEFLSAVEAVQELIRTQPLLGRRGLLDTLSFRTKRFPFRIVYELQPDRIWIVAVAHCVLHLNIRASSTTNQSRFMAGNKVC